jgi:hypothetical protein
MFHNLSPGLLLCVIDPPVSGAPTTVYNPAVREAFGGFPTTFSFICSSAGFG